MRGREDQAEWAMTECAAADLGDPRLTRRLVDLVTALADHPSASLPAARTDPARLKAAYRSYDNDAGTPAALLARHRQATYRRVRRLPLVLAVNDTSRFDWTQHPATTGLGPLTTAHQQGVLVHSTLAVTPERVPLGLLGQEVWERAAATFGRQADRHDRPIEEKERRKWLASLAVVTTAAAAGPTTRGVHVGDAEADVDALFLAERAATVDLLVRGEADERYPRRARRPAPVASQVELAVRWRAVTVRPPRKRATERLPHGSPWAVLATEQDPPAGENPIEWLLLTPVPITWAAEAEACLAWSTCRWGIEVWHTLLKSGGQSEARHLATGGRRRQPPASSSTHPPSPASGRTEPAGCRRGRIGGTSTPAAATGCRVTGVG